MNLIFKRISISGFQSLGEEISIDLQQRGITLIKGINLYEENASSNGSGKSSIFESIFFSLYGMTTNGVVYPANRYLKNGYSLKLEFNLNNVNYTIIRTGKGKTSTVTIFKDNKDISKRNKTDTEKFIQNDILKLPQDLFLSTVFLSQGFNGDISKLTPSGRKERIETLINTAEVTEGFRKEVQKIKDDYFKNASEILQTINYDKGNLDSLKRENERIEKFIQETLQEGNYTLTIEELQNEINSLQEQIEVLETNEKRFNELYQDARNDLSVCSLNIRNNSNLILNKESEINRLRTSDTCPTCGRKFDGINEDHINNSIKLLENEIKSLKDDNVNLNNNYNTYNDKMSKYSSKCSEISRIISENKNKLSTYKEELLERTKSKDTSEQENRLNENKISIVDLSEKIEKNNIIYNNEIELSEVANHCTVLINKQFRNYLLKTAIDFLNERLKHYSKLLFSNETDVISFVQDASKLDIYLGDADFKTLSGGEKKKVCISLILAQKDLATRMSGLNSNILILDEVFENLDPEAVDVVIDALTQVSSDVDSMFVISHKETNIGYDNIITVTKGKDRISNVVDTF